MVFPSHEGPSKARGIFSSSTLKAAMSVVGRGLPLSLRDWRGAAFPNEGSAKEWGSEEMKYFPLTASISLLHISHLFLCNPLNLSLALK